MSFTQWWKRKRKWRGANTSSWDGMDIPGQKGLTQFQETCLEALGEVIDVSQCSLEGEEEKYITGRFRETHLRYYIYEDGAEISGTGTDMRFERWDHSTPQELVKRFLEEAKKVEL
jgi:hypothetical protein